VKKNRILEIFSSIAVYTQKKTFSNEAQRPKARRANENQWKKSAKEVHKNYFPILIKLISKFLCQIKFE